MTPFYDRGGITVYHGDCREILPAFPAGTIVSDPPYGIGYTHGAGGPKRRPGFPPTRKTDPIIGDDKPFDPSHLLRFGNVLLWGANHYAPRLPEGGRWLAWDKLDGMEFENDQSDVEFAWHSRPGASRKISFRWKGLACVKAGESGGRRVHPTQKPVKVMQWSIAQARPEPGLPIIDPYAGSGTTGVACLRAGLPCILIEQDEQYLPIIKSRLEDALTPMFDVPAVQPAGMGELFPESP